MPFHGCIVVIKRSGADGSTYPLVKEVIRIKLCELMMITKSLIGLFQTCILGRAEGCDIRIQLPIVSKEHAKVSVHVKDGKVWDLLI